MNLIKTIESPKDEYSLASATTQRLLDDVAASLEIYRKVAVRCESNPISSKFFLRANQKQSHYHELSQELEIDARKHTLSFKQRLALKMDKLWIEINHLLIRLDMKELLAICVKQETKLIVTYERTIKEVSKNSELGQLLEAQRDASLELLKELRSEQREYNFLEKA